MPITDDQNELFDLVDESDQVIGRISRREAHHNPQLIHRSVGVLVFNRQGELFMQKRSLTKDLDAGLWAISVGGHPSAGQDSQPAAIRELKEELGIESQISLVKKYLVRLATETELQTAYQTKHNGPFKLNSDEVETGSFFHLEQIEHMVNRKQMTVSLCSLICLHICLGMFTENTKLKAQVLKIFR